MGIKTANLYTVKINPDPPKRGPISVTGNFTLGKQLQQAHATITTTITTAAAAAATTTTTTAITATTTTALLLTQLGVKTCRGDVEENCV